MMNPSIVQRKSLADEVAAHLQDSISSGKFQINQKLPVEADLMRNFGVGRSTIREAVKILANSGFLRVKQGIGTFVEDASGINEPITHRLKRARIEDIAEVRQILELKIAEKAALNRTGNDISKLQHCLDKWVKAANDDSLNECVDAYLNFHILLAEAAKNDILADLYKLFALQLKSELFNKYEDTSFFKDTLEQYKNLLDGVLRQDAKKAWYWSAKITGNGN